MISLWVQQDGGSWFGVAEHEGMLVATVKSRTREEAARSLLGCLPGAPHRFVEEASEFFRETVRMLARIESGDESGKRFALCPTYVPEPKSRVLRAAAAIPLGYVSTYGSIASVSGTNARVVGRIMATNPLYPIVPCHRVVGSDLSLVGYGGRQSPAALRAKLDRLRAEARGCTTELQVLEVGGLRVQPVERVLSKAARDGLVASAQLSLW